MKISAERARELAWGSDPDGELEVTCRRLTGTSRWTSRHELVVQDKQGRYWRAFYEQGLTGHQDAMPFGEQDEAEFTEVEPVPVTVCEYRDKDAGQCPSSTLS